jgi:hypothetical protein
MQEAPVGEVTMLLQQMRAGDSQAADKLIPLVVDELRRLARRQLRDERPGHTLQPTALVNEAYLRLVGDSGKRLAESVSFHRGQRLGSVAANGKQMMVLKQSAQNSVGGFW